LIANSIDPSLRGLLVDPRLEAVRQQLRELLKYALIVVASVPMLVIYPFVQRYFAKGLLIGAIKG
jgi:ABC-type glycerol-3-phosphate transport system permease component